MDIFLRSFQEQDRAHSMGAPGPPFFPWPSCQGCVKVAQWRHLPHLLHMCHAPHGCHKSRTAGAGRLLTHHLIHPQGRTSLAYLRSYLLLPPSLSCLLHHVTQGKTDSDLPEIRRPHLQPRECNQNSARPPRRGKEGAEFLLADPLMDRCHGKPAASGPSWGLLKDFPCLV